MDIYQTARVVKVLMMMEKGVPAEFKGKNLSEIEITPDEYIEDDKGQNEEIISDSKKNGKIYNVFYHSIYFNPPSKAMTSYGLHLE